VEKIINEQNWSELSKCFLTAEPYNHVVIENFFTSDFALELSENLPDYHGNNLDAKYDNPIEKKRTIQNWTKFPKSIYTAFSYLINQEFTRHLRELTQQEELCADYGLHGGGVHLHQKGDYLNIHLDYDSHPKLDMKRKLNLIIYLTKDWQENWGGAIELWSHNDETLQPKERIKKVVPKFNTAILFDTTQNSWHGLPEPMNPPDYMFRKSLALYYLIPTEDVLDKRTKALFTPSEHQKGDEEILKFIKKRSEV
jgi:Rps23 Pro-64 3,4-dihydroxylase Tpa1-like proline 4-hydroxylase